jgi:hypothetical protein
MVVKMPNKKTKEIDEPSKVIQILLAGLLLKEEPRPNVRKLERLIKVEDGTLSELFPQRKGRKKMDAKPKGQTNTDIPSKEEHNTNV